MSVQPSKTHTCLGIMSGTSLDGVDIVAVSFVYNTAWEFSILASHTYEYDSAMLARLKGSQHLTGLELTQLDVDYGKYLGELVNDFNLKFKVEVDFVASHGYTVFHEPAKGFTLQIGSGAQLAATTQLKTICDFRTLDVSLGGQGAPLVPIGDKLLFDKYVACINLGGFSNISYYKENQRIAFDICPANYVLNHYAEKLGKTYDKGGQLGKQGSVSEALLAKLNELAFYKLNPPKSLGREFVETEIYPLIPGNLTPLDVLSTFYEHIAYQISKLCNTLPKGDVLVTGGGAHNTFLMHRIKELSQNEIIIPSNPIVDFKEAIIFAFLGLLRVMNKNNCLASVTGAQSDNCGGAIYQGDCLE